MKIDRAKAAINGDDSWYVLNALVHCALCDAFVGRLVDGYDTFYTSISIWIIFASLWQKSSWKTERNSAMQ